MVEFDYVVIKPARPMRLEPRRSKLAGSGRGWVSIYKS